MKLHTVAATLLIGALAGCAMPAPLTKQQMAAMDYGQPMNQAQATATAKQWFDARLKDPYSAVYHWQPIMKGVITTSLVEGHQRIAGYILDGTVNAKNGFGGYAGATEYQLLIRNGTVVHASERDPETGDMVSM